jgi:hypothetical protein
MPQSTNRVFLNVPFDKPYEPIFIGLVGALVHLGKRPTTVLELAGGAAPRLDRLIAAIRENPFSVHDLSRVEPSGRGPSAVPRFNMPFELGLAVAVSLTERQRPRHGFVLLESRPFRIQRSLSDMNGHDPFIHNGTQGGAIRSMVEAFSIAGPTDIGAARRLVRRLGHVADNLKRTHRADTLFSRTMCNELIDAATRLRDQEAVRV